MQFQLILGRELAELLSIPEKFLLFAILAFNSLMAFLESYFLRACSSFYTLYLTTRISRLPHKVVPRYRGSSTLGAEPFSTIVVIIGKGAH